MVGTRRTTRGDVHRRAKEAQTPKTDENVSKSRPKRKAAQEAAEKVEAGAKSKGKKRVKKAIPYLPEHDEAGNYPNNNTPFANLPREIFDEIMSLLEPDAQTCLSLTCKEILSIVGREIWSECRSKRQLWQLNHLGHGSYINFRHTLIPLLARDSPHLMECGPCMTLHPPLKPPREHRETSLTKACFGRWSTIDYLPKDDFGGYSLLWEHVVEARKNLTEESSDTIGSPIALLSGNFTMRHDRLNYTLISSGRQVKKNLVLKHEHIFHSTDSRSPLKLADIIALPVRLCPHQTTSTLKPQTHTHTKDHLPSGLLTHSIATAAPKSLRAGLPTPDMFSIPAPSEKKQMDSVVPDVKTLWTCRACPTKWHVQYDGEGGGELKITVWHSLGDTAYRAQEYWKLLVRRDMVNLGGAKRNSEFFVVSKHYGNFEINDEE